jgi:citrate lyase beta subunit
MIAAVDAAMPINSSERASRSATAWQLGASLYVPATRNDIVEIAAGEKIPQLRSVILCTEDAVLEADLPKAVSNIAFALPQLGYGPLRFVRVRNSAVLARVLSMPGNFALTGFVLPKITADNIGDYLSLLGSNSPFSVMITVETREAFSISQMERLRDTLLECQANVLSIRIGGNDLLSVLSLRRARGVTAYDTPLGPLIDQLVAIFKPWGFNLSGPVYDYTEDPLTLALETRLDLQHGLFGKTAIHPRQIEIIEAEYRVDLCDVERAELILKPDAPAVFRVGDTMCEPTTHRKWASMILERARVYGICAAEHLHMPTAL